MSEGSGAVRVRFAPSPTGYFHVGGARTALYNWLFARRLGGTFVLRIEDTDRERSDETWTEGILAALSWLGITWDEGPYFQSSRTTAYASAVEVLLAGGHLYACDCTRQAIDARTKNNPIPGYDGFCRDRGLEPSIGRALRFRVPDEGVTVVHDLIRGDVEFAHATIEDFVAVKSNGDPLFVLANVVDDRAMTITHVIRGEEHLPTTPKALLIWEALGGVELPLFAHVPVLVNEKRQKLSKRRDRVAVEDYEVLGILPEAMVNFLALLGWGPGGDREVLSLEDLVEEFRVEDVNRSPAYFDEKRLLHFNGLYIRELPVEDFVQRARPFLSGHGRWDDADFDPDAFNELAPLVQERIAALSEIPDLIAFLFESGFTPDEDAFEKVIARDDGARDILARAYDGFSAIEWTAAALRTVVESIGLALDRKLARTQAPIRVATLGRSVGLPLFEALECLGRERALERIEAALGRLTAPG